MLYTKNLSHSYTEAQRFEFPDIKCNASETLLVLGSSGVGKTTLLHILAGILKPKAGEVNVDGKSIYNQAQNKLDKFRGQNIGLVFQKPHFVQSVSAQENLLLAQKMAGFKPDTTRANKLLEALDISHRKDARAFEMSQGEQQRLSIARALINAPKLILADEPTSALDDVNCSAVIKLLEQQAEEVNAALVIVTHDNRLTNFFSQHIKLGV